MKPGNRGKQRCQFQQVGTWQMRFAIVLAWPLLLKGHFFYREDQYLNRKGKWLFTSESVTEGHPDKLCDQISDAILDALLAEDPQARVACETAATTGMVLVMGEITTGGYADIPRIVRDTIRDIGYTGHDAGF